MIHAACERDPGLSNHTKVKGWVTRHTRVKLKKDGSFRRRAPANFILELPVRSDLLGSIASPKP
jgi:hypothetical protein